MNSITRSKTPSRTEREYVRATARRCRGRTLIVSRDASLLESAVLEVTSEVICVQDHTSLPDDTFKTILIADMLEHLDETDGKELLYNALDLLGEGGRLVVSVPNEKSQPDSGQITWFSRKTLRRSLKPLGKATLAADQPYRWLTMIVQTPVSRRSIDRVKRSRFRATSRLCRGRVIELGCGEGHLTRAITDRGLEVLGIDLSVKRIERARRFYPDLEFRQSDILDFETDITYDTVVIAEVLEHVDEETGNAMLERAWELLSPGGRLVVSVPNEDLVPHPNHVREFTRRSLKQWLSHWGRPRLITDQPFKWLMMTVEKKP